MLYGCLQVTLDQPVIRHIFSPLLYGNQGSVACLTIFSTDRLVLGVGVEVENARSAHATACSSTRRLGGDTSLALLGRGVAEAVEARLQLRASEISVIADALDQLRDDAAREVRDAAADAARELAGEAATRARDDAERAAKAEADDTAVAAAPVAGARERARVRRCGARRRLPAAARRARRRRAAPRAFVCVSRARAQRVTQPFLAPRARRSLTSASLPASAACALARSTPSGLDRRRARARRGGVGHATRGGLDKEAAALAGLKSAHAKRLDRDRRAEARRQGARGCS